MLSLDSLSKLYAMVCLAILITLSGCKSSKTSPIAQSDPLELTELTQEKLGSSAVTTFNKQKTHALVSTVRKDKNAAFASVRFFVYDVENAEVILEEFIAQGRVTWLDNQQIRVSVTTGVPQEGATAGYIFNVGTGAKTPIKN